MHVSSSHKNTVVLTYLKYLNGLLTSFLGLAPSLGLYKILTQILSVIIGQPLYKQLNGYNPGYSQLRTRVLPMPDCRLHRLARALIVYNYR